MDYVFIFIGEFGYELFDWVAKVNELTAKLKKNYPDSSIVVGGRKGLNILYDNFDFYVDISEVSLYKESVASGYFARLSSDDNLLSPNNLLFNELLKAQVQRFIIANLVNEFPNNKDLFSYKFIFSSNINVVQGVKLGQDPYIKWNNIYNEDVLINNKFKKIDGDKINEFEVPSATRELVKSLGKKNYILVQSRRREVVVRSSTRINEKKLIDNLSINHNIILINFDTGRKFDSKSDLKKFDSSKVINIECNSFIEQCYLILNSKLPVFLTEGDFGSHIYVPPFLGVNVIAIAPSNIYNIGTTPIKFWNNKIFANFNSSIIPLKFNECEDNSDCSEGCDDNSLEIVNFINNYIERSRIDLFFQKLNKNLISEL